MTEQTQKRRNLLPSISALYEVLTHLFSFLSNLLPCPPNATSGWELANMLDVHRWPADDQ